MKQTLLTTIALLGMLISAGTVSGDVVHDEGIDGDLSGVFGTPTAINFLPGDNTVLGQVGDNGNTGATDGTDADYFTVVIEAGEQLDSINVDSRSGAGQSFFGYIASSSFAGQGGGDIDGFVLFSNTSGEVLDDLTGVADPLGPGTYSFWVQETSPTPIDYSFTFGVSSVPEPSSMLLGVLGCCGLIARRRRS